MNDLSKTSQYDRQSNEEYDSEESGYVASQIGGSYQDQIYIVNSLLEVTVVKSYCLENFLKF